MLLIQNGLLHTMENDQPVYADLLIKNGKIEKIAPSVQKTENMKVLDAQNLLVFPGFLDAHSHIGISEEKVTGIGDECNENTTPATPHLRSIDSIHPMDSAFHNALASGVTGAMIGPGSSNPVGGQFAFIKTYGRCIDDMIVLAPSAIKIAFGENPMTTYGTNGNLPSTRMGIAAVIREELFHAKQYLANTPPDSNQKDFRLESYWELFEKKIPLKAHVHRTDDIFTAIRIAREFDLDLTLDHCEGMKEIDALRAITLDAAKICRVDHRLGSLTVGKDADIVLWDGNPLDVKSSVIKTLIDGAVVWEKEKE